MTAADRLEEWQRWARSIFPMPDTDLPCNNDYKGKGYGCKTCPVFDNIPSFLWWESGWGAIDMANEIPESLDAAGEARAYALDLLIAQQLMRAHRRAIVRKYLHGDIVNQLDLDAAIRALDDLINPRVRRAA